MIRIDLGVIEYFDDSKKKFVYKNGGFVEFEYSLKAIYEWEGIWKKPFINKEHSNDEILHFYKLMADRDFDDEFLTIEITNMLSKYIGESHTATTFSNQEVQNGSRSSKILTSEEIYAMMFDAGIPLEFENRNLNRLMVMLKVISNRNNPPKKMSKQDILKQNSELNRQRREMLKTKG